MIESGFRSVNAAKTSRAFVAQLQQSKQIALSLRNSYPYATLNCLDFPAAQALLLRNRNCSSAI
jgi:hypothetical protein